MFGIIWSRLSEAALRPGRRLMSSLHLPTKLGLMGLLLAVPVCVLLADVLSAARADLAILERERAGVTVARAMYRLTADLQALRAAATHRGMARDPAQDLPAATSRLQATVAELDQSLAALTAFEVLDEWNKLRPLALELTASPQGLSRSASFAGVGAVIDRAAVMLSLVGERSELLFDPKPDTFFLMDIVLERLPPLAESAARLGDYGVPVINRGEASNRDRWAMAAFADNLLRQQASVAARLDSLARADVQPPTTWLAVVTSTQLLAAATNEAFAGDQIAQDSAALANATDAVVATVHRLSGDAMTELDRRLAKREVEHRYAMLASMAAAMLGILGVLYLAASFFLSFRDSLRGLVGAVRAMAVGDLSQRITPVGTDELAGMAIDLETTSGKLSALVAEIRSSAVRVDQAGTEVSRDGQALSSRTETQASGLRQAVASVRQLSAAVAANTAVVTALNERAITLGTQGLSCNEVMARSVQTMEQLDQSVRRVGEINAVIDDIAFQTNLLSLNASVEAARAGEQGKGFGVVAAEVRELSLRCAEAAAEVRELIDQTAGHAGLSRDSLAEASNLLNSLVGGIGVVSDGLKQVSGVGVEQSRDLESVMHSVNELDDITQQNAQAVATSAKASGSLAAQAAVLRTSVGTIQLRQGSADEARSLVERAMSRIALSGWEAAVADFNRRDGGFADRDLFIFAVDSEDRYIAMSAKPELVGSSIYDAPNMPAALADEYLRLARAACAKGGGWIDYEMLDIATHQPIVKSAFIADLGDGAFLGASVQRMSDASLTAAST